MLPVVSTLKTKLIAGSVAVGLLATSAAPAMAWGQREQDFTKGVLATVLLGAAIHEYNHPTYVQPRRQPVYYQPVYQQPVYQQPVYQPPVYQQPVYQQSLYSTAAAQAFNAYSPNERIRIQATLTNYGYYHGRLDGSFGPGTYDAVVAYARHAGRLPMLDTRGGAFGLFDGLIS